MTVAGAHSGRSGADAVPLVIGVTGHRDLVPAEVGLLEAAVERFFDGLRSRFPDLPILVMTPLAEGADRLVARVAKRVGIAVSVLVPMPMQLYRADFDAASDDDFAALASGREIIELPLLPGIGPADVHLPGLHRDRQYEYLGVYLAAHCHILLALWDGRDNPAPGGTARVIRIHQQDTAELIATGEARSPIDFSEDESDLVCHVVCGRIESGAPAADLRSGQVAWLSRDDVAPRTDELPERYAGVFERMAEFNRDLARLPRREVGEPLLADDLGAELGLTAELQTRYQVADGLAVHFQRRALRALRAMFVLVGLTGACFILYADFDGLGLMIYGYLLCLSLAVGLYLLERRQQWYRRYLDYRVLAEGLRVQFYWALAGVSRRSVTHFAHDLFLKRQDLELGWIRNLMRFAGRRVDAAARGDTPEDLHRAIDAWIGSETRGQLGYYRQAMSMAARRARRTARIANVCLAGGILLALCLALWGGAADGLAQNLLIALMGGLPFAAAIRQGYAHRVAERELAAQYAHMARLLSNARRLIDVTRSHAVQLDVLRALGEAAMEEHGLWLLRQRERPLSSGQLLAG